MPPLGGRGGARLSLIILSEFPDPPLCYHTNPLPGRASQRLHHFEGRVHDGIISDAIALHQEISSEAATGAPPEYGSG